MWNNNIENAVKEQQKYTDAFTEYIEELRERAGDNMLEEFCKMRQFSMQTVKEQGIFYIGDATEMLIPAYLDKVESFGVISPTNKKPIFHNRYVMPIKDENGKVLNVVGYAKDADERYVYGTSKYYRRRDTMYGLENLKLAYELGFAILTEGITDAIRIRDLGYKNTFANCGTHGSDFIMKQLDRCRYGVLKVPDRDAAGLRASKKWKCNRSITLNSYVMFKDIDEMCSNSEEMKSIVEEHLGLCVDWLKQKEHQGKNHGEHIITIG